MAVIAGRIRLVESALHAADSRRETACSAALKVLTLNEGNLAEMELRIGRCKKHQEALVVALQIIRDVAEAAFVLTPVNGGAITAAEPMMVGLVVGKVLPFPSLKLC